MRPRASVFRQAILPEFLFHVTYVTYVTDGIESAMAQAKAAAGDRNVLVHGAYTAQRTLEAGVLDELQIHKIPVLFGGGRRLFEVLPSRVEGLPAASADWTRSRRLASPASTQ